MAKKVTVDVVWAGFVGLQKVHAKTESAIKETQRMFGDLGNKFGDEAEHTLIPGLPGKFSQFGFVFGALAATVVH
jgi:hypothetical protein